MERERQKEKKEMIKMTTKEKKEKKETGFKVITPLSHSLS